MRISQETIDDIRNSASISEVIGHYIPLIKKGKGYTAVCPFHDDHDPSLSISDDKQIYKCFVCGNGGNVFTFVSNFKKISFLESVNEVATIIGKPLNIEINTAPKKVSKYQKYYDMLNDMISYSNYLLTSSSKGKEALDYLSKRGLESEIIERFSIGYNPEDNYVYKYLQSRNYSDEDMIKAGIVRRLDFGNADVFYKRVLFPIHDNEGNPVAFTARDYIGDLGSKYINSSDTLIYTKGDIIYNYHRAKEACRKAGYVIVCEGVMDVIAYYRAGIENVVATLGTACTNKQFELLTSLSKHLVLSYDGDKAGTSANMKLGQMALNNGIKVSVVDNRSELDPDEIITVYGKNALRDLAGKHITYIDFVMNYYKNHFNLENYEDRKKMSLLVSELIDKLTDEYDKENYTNELYSLTRIRRRETVKQDKKEYNTYIVQSYSIDGLTKAEYSIISMMLSSRKAVGYYQKELGYLLDEVNQKLAMMIIDDYRNNERVSLSRIYDETDDDSIKNVITALATMDDLPNGYDEVALNAAVVKIKTELKKRRLKELQQKIYKTSNLSTEETNMYLNEYMQLVKEVGGSYEENKKQ